MLKKLFGDENTKFLKKLAPQVEEVNRLESSISDLSDGELSEKTNEFKRRLERGETCDDILCEAFAVVRETAQRTLGQRHYDEQIIGGIVLHKGNIAEMKTGEGKTLVATLPVYLNALSGRGVHVVTVNDYLARRDAVWMGQIYAFLGLSVGVINGQNQSYLYDFGHTDVDKSRDEQGSFKVFYEFLRPCKKNEAYAADITYGTNSEFGFDYLRDNTAYRREDLAQRPPDTGGFSFAIIDEIDSVLIDEARTPLIISMPSRDSENLYATFSNIARQLKEGEHYEIDEKRRAITLTDEGIEKAEKILGVDNIYTDAGIKYVHHLETAVRAKALYHRDKEYVLRDGQVIIVDEFTGRLQPGRRWSEGLHQAIEAKEGVDVQQESRTFASITYQNYFRLYEKLSGMTGTAQSSAEEFQKVYDLDTISIPTHEPLARIDKDDLIFRTEKGKFSAIAKKVKEKSSKGQPVLIGTISVEENERLAKYLDSADVSYEILNAKNHEREGEIVAQAGRRSAVTVATNMAGRGVDIKLGGATEDKTLHDEVSGLGGLFVLGTERHEARRIDDQLRGRSGRQGDPGETQFFVSLEDKLMRVFATDAIDKLMGRLNMPEDEPIQNSIITRSLENAQKKIEGLNFDARKHVLEFDDVLNTQRQSIYDKRRRVLLGDVKDVEHVVLEFIGDDEKGAEKLEERKRTLGDEAFVESVRRLILQTIDLFWVQHLEVMDYLRASVGLRAYGQRDPLIEYRKEGRKLFAELEDSIASRIGELIPSLGEGSFAKEELRLQKERQKIKTIGSGGQKEGTARVEKIGRNERVTITDGKETKEMKYKKAESLIESGEWKLVNG